MNQGKFRKREKPFTQISNHLLRDENVSLKAKGLYCLISSYLNIPDYVLYKNALRKCCPEGRDSFDKAWNELKDAGYLIQYKIKSEQGRFIYEYELLDEPTTSGFSVPGEPVNESSDSIKREEHKNIKQKNNSLNNNSDNFNDCDKASKENVVVQKMRQEDINAYFDKFSDWFKDYSKIDPEKTFGLKEKLTKLFKTIPAYAAEIVRNFNEYESLKFFGIAMEVYYPSSETIEFANPVFNKEGYLVGVIKNFAIK